MASFRWWLPVAAICLVPAAASAQAVDGAIAEAVLAQSASPKTVVFSENEVRGRTVATDAGGLLQILFADGTTLTLGPNSELTVDLFTYEPESAAARLAATLRRGVFRFIGGRASKTPEGVALATPFGTLAIESAGVDISLGSDGSPAHFDMVYGGSMSLSGGASGASRVHTPGYSIVLQAGGAAVQKTPAEWRAALQEQLSFRPGTATLG